MQKLPALALLAFGLVSTRSEAQCLSAKVTPEGDAKGDHFGYAVELVDDWLFVGAPLDNVFGRNSGLVRVYVRDGLNWFLKSRLVASDAHRGQTFGTELASDGRTLVVTASRAEFADAVGPGALYVFEEHGGIFDYMQQLAPLGPRPAPEDLFGLALALEGDWLFAGAARDSEAGPEVGAVHVYRRVTGVWTPHGKLVPARALPRSLFGHDLAVSGGRLVVGAPSDPTRAPSGGSVHVFELEGEQWIERAQLFPRVARADASFGSAVALEGTTLACGASGDNEFGLEAGAVHVFELDAGSWSEVARLAPTTLAASDYLGRELELTGGKLLAAASGHGANGAVFEFGRTGGTFELEAVLEPEDAPAVAPPDWFGADLAASGDLVAIGAYWNDQQATDAGAVYVHDATGRGCASLTSPREESWGRQRLVLERGVAHAGHPYWLAGSMSGTSPGLRFRGQRIPLNLDGYFRSCLRSPNAGWFTNNLGRLDGNGRATVDLRIPPEAYAALVGVTLHHAFMEFAPGEGAHVSNVVALRFGARR